MKRLWTALLTRPAGIGYFIAGMLFFSGMNVAIRAMSGQMDPLQMVFLRNLFGFILLLPFALRAGRLSVRTQHFGKHFQRAFIGLIAMETWFISLAHLPVNTATAISFSAPLFSTVFAVLLLGERIGWMRICALAAGFAGVLIIINPASPDAWNEYGLLVLFSAAMMAVAGIMVKRLTSTEPSWRIVFYTTLLMSALSLPLALTVWQEPRTDDLLHLLLIAALSTLAQICLTQALKLEAIVVLAPFEFLRLVFTAAIAWVAFAEPIGASTVLGGAVIVGSAAFITWRESVRKRKITSRETLV